MAANYVMQYQVTIVIHTKERIMITWLHHTGPAVKQEAHLLVVSCRSVELEKNTELQTNHTDLYTFYFTQEYIIHIDQ